jgi:hypothetical protein
MQLVMSLAGKKNKHKSPVGLGRILRLGRNVTVVWNMFWTGISAYVSLENDLLSPINRI